MSEPLLSVVVPAYNEQPNLSQLYAELMQVLPALDVAWELILVDDGSSDGTWKEIAALHERDPRVRGLRLSRNFGHQYALLAGLTRARGAAVVTMDADLQHPPDVIPQLLEAWRRGDRVVHTIRVAPPDFSRFKRISAALFYRVFSLLSGVDLSPGMADFRLLDRQVVDCIARFRDEGLFLRGIVQWVGYQSSSVSFQSRVRYGGRTKYTVREMLRFAWHGITSFSIVPLRIGVLLGLLTSGVAFLWFVYAVYAKVVSGATVPGWASAISVISFLFGILFILLGILGEYIGRIFLQVRARPPFVVCESVGLENFCPDAPQLRSD